MSHYILPVIISNFKMTPLAKQRTEVLEILTSIQGPITAQPGCLSCDIYAEIGLGGSIMFSEQWESEASLQEHIRSDLYLRILLAAELSRKAPEIRFYRVSDTQGLELIRQLRAGSENQPASILEVSALRCKPEPCLAPHRKKEVDKQ